jgi:hypothetical protein
LLLSRRAASECERSVGCCSEFGGPLTSVRTVAIIAKASSAQAELVAPRVGHHDEALIIL